MAKFKFVIITPVRNEEKYISTTIKCMLKQTVKPFEWIIVNDGSRDQTEKIIMELITGNQFIRYIKLEDRGFRKPGQGVVESFYEGFKRIETKNYEVLAKFDGDLDFPSNTLETIARAFREDANLGVTGGTRYERLNNHSSFKKVTVPEGFVGGPFKFYRRECFEDIGGIIRRAGWDGVDTVKANMRGWRTYEIESLKIYHLKSTGLARGEGLVKACEKYGDVSYYMGGYLFYFLMRVAMRSFQRRSFRFGYHMLKGYLKSKFKNQTRESDEFRSYFKRIQLQRTRYWLRFLFSSLDKRRAKNNSSSSFSESSLR